MGAALNGDAKNNYQLLATGIYKRYGSRNILCDLDLAVDSGVIALMGSNGAGKTTLLHILAGAIAADAGEVKLCGVDLTIQPIAARRLLSFVPAEPSVYPFLTGDEFVRFVGFAKGFAVDGPTEDLLDAFELRNHRNKRFDQMSLGTQRKFYLAAALRAEPKILILDEPTNAIDARSLAFLKQYLLNTAQCRTVLFASHDAPFIEDTATQILELREGRANFVDPKR